MKSKFVDFRRINNDSNFIYMSNNDISIKIENDDRIYLIPKCSNDQIVTSVIMMM
jgi:hypothetical protein